MYRSFAICVLLLLGFTSLRAQKTQDFEIHLPGGKISNSQYNTIKCLDSRSDTTNMGIVQLGAFNRKARVIPKKPLLQQLSAVFNSQIDETAKSGELVLQIRQFVFAEVTAGFSEKGYCSIRAEAYAKQGARYQKLNTLDTIICLKSGMDVTDTIIKSGAINISNFIAFSLLKQPAGPGYTYADIMAIDDYEKQQLKLFTTNAYTDGLYLTYQSFRDQRPDQQFTADADDPNMATIKTTGADGKPQKVKAKNVYALVYKGQPYISNSTDYCSLKKVNNDLLFTGRAKASANSTEVMTASMLFGVLGGLFAANDASIFEMKIDHKNGGFIRLREIIPKPYEQQ